jgi:hypothetical protein
MGSRMRIADCGMRIEECRLKNAEYETRNDKDTLPLHSAIRNPQYPHSKDL